MEGRKLTTMRDMEKSMLGMIHTQIERGNG